MNREFEWAGRRWRIPCLYLCGRGLVLDLCMRVEPSALQAFAAKWDISVLYGQEASLSSEQRMLLALDNPLYLEFRCVPHVNARALHAVRSWATVYARLSPEAAVEDQAVNAVQHYGLDPEAAWVIRRFFLPLGDSPQTPYPHAVRHPQPGRGLAARPPFQRDRPGRYRFLFL